MTMLRFPRERSSVSTPDEGIDLHQLPGHEHGTGVGQVSTLGEQPRAPGCCRPRPSAARRGSTAAPRAARRRQQTAATREPLPANRRLGAQQVAPAPTPSCPWGGTGAPSRVRAGGQQRDPQVGHDFWSISTGLRSRARCPAPARRRAARAHPTGAPLEPTPSGSGPSPGGPWSGSGWSRRWAVMALSLRPLVPTGGKRRGRPCDRTCEGPRALHVRPEAPPDGGGEG